VVRLLSLITVLCLSACSKAAPAPATAASAPKPAASAALTTQTPGQSGSAVPAAAQEAAPAAKPVPAQLPDVVARVNGENITKADFETAVKNVEARAGEPVPADQRDRIYRGLLDQLIGYKLLEQETKARKVQVPQTDIDARVAEIQKQFPNEDAFKKALQEQHVTVDQLKSDARSDMAVDKLITDAIAAKVAVKPEDVQAFYKANQDHFKQGDRVRASHILITVPQNADAATKAQARAKAEDLLKQIKAGKDFAELAKANSQDPGSAPNGGDLGYFAQGDMVGPFNDVAFSLKPGQVSDVVETQFGFHIIKVVDKQAGTTVPFDQAKGQIEQYLQQQNRQRETEAFVAGLRSKGKVEIFI
jgi:peptidyl-prolyl cis-trans isomerase C